VGAQIVLKATKVDGVYSPTRTRIPSAVRYTRISFDDALARNLQIMDATPLRCAVTSDCRSGSSTSPNRARCCGPCWAKTRVLWYTSEPRARFRATCGFGLARRQRMKPTEIRSSTEQKMLKSVESLKHDLAKIRTGRAHTGLLDHIQVDYYGSMVPLSQVANVGLADARPSPCSRGKEDADGDRKGDPGIGSGAESGLAGRAAAHPMPPLTEERGGEMTKVVAARRRERAGGGSAICGATRFTS